MKTLISTVLIFITISCNSLKKDELSYRNVSSIKLYSIDLKKCVDSKSVSLYIIKDTLSCFKFYRKIKKQNILSLINSISKKDLYRKGVGYTFDAKFALLLDFKDDYKTIDFDGFGQVKISSKKSKKVYLLTPKGKKVYDNIFKSNIY